MKVQFSFISDIIANTDFIASIPVLPLWAKAVIAQTTENNVPLINN